MISTSEDVVETAYRPFLVQVRRVTRLSPSFARVTFTGPDLEAFADNGHDQRIKVVLPLLDHGFAQFPMTGDWYDRWRLLPGDLQNPIRTYTVRAARPHAAEVDVDFVLHGEHGPASRWASSASAGDSVVLVGPNARYPGETAATTWRPPGEASRLLIGVDETGLPALSVIIAGLPSESRGIAVIEVPDLADRLPLDGPPGLRIDWRARTDGHGTALEAGVREAAATMCGVPPQPGDDPGPDTDELWDVPDVPSRGSAVYAWLAGEAGAIARLRRHLVRDLAMDRTSVAFMGYWRLGRSET
jgi:NADPH-dependent ferric siderophore reductase